METKTLAKQESELCDELKAFAAKQGLALHSADEMIAELQNARDVMDARIAWLQNFIERWNTWESVSRVEYKVNRMTLPSPESVAENFAAVLMQWLGPKKFAAMQKINREENADSDCCASHNYCDANMAMDLALRQVCPALGDILDESWAENETLCELWNNAWGIAKREYLS